MGKLSNNIAVSDLRQSTAKVLQQVKKSTAPLIITQRGHAAAVLLGIDTYEKSERDKKILRLLPQGEKEIDAGEGYDLDAVLAEADSLLSQEPS